MQKRYNIVRLHTKGEFVGVMNEQFNSIKNYEINNVKLLVFSQWTAVSRLTTQCNMVGE
jgi:6-phosphogluconolactonase (cycloisomerase 2 family)